MPKKRSGKKTVLPFVNESAIGTMGYGHQDHFKIGAHHMAHANNGHVVYGAGFGDWIANRGRAAAVGAARGGLEGLITGNGFGDWVANRARATAVGAARGGLEGLIKG
jgi:hypothetical protein